jgi:hypothetical protein
LTIASPMSALQRWSAAVVIEGFNQNGFLGQCLSLSRQRVVGDPYRASFGLHVSEAEVAAGQ